MNKETKKLITAGMLSDVMGVKIKDPLPVDERNIVYAEEIAENKFELKSLSIHELKDRLEGWLTKNENHILTIKFGRIAAYCLLQEDMPNGRTIAKSVGYDNLEALLKLYHEVKANQ